MILFFDTETSGLPDFNQRARHSSQPHIVQMAALLTDDAGKDLECVNLIVKPDGWSIPKEASDIHGITNEFAKANGVDEETVIDALLSRIRRASLTVAHNHQFDKFIARVAARRFNLITDADDEWWKGLPSFCTMREMTDVCCLPGKWRGSYKWPKLQEAFYYAFGRTFEKAHDAMADVRACRDVYFWLKKEMDVMP